ncbi:MAG: hypothetical protein CMP83_10615 [Gammaproteobacteria bacterium]|nr:hypothetical protein [Gammaproteobacteria bacterium]
MANLVSYAIPNLIQGVSQQPDAQRDPSQGAIQINGVSSIAEGLRKRDFTRTLAKVSTTPFGDAFIHSILRDQSEEYLAVITKNGIQVFDLDGTPIDVTEDTDAYDYLKTVTDARKQIRAVTVADFTFICNLNTSTAMQSKLAPAIARPKPHECLVWIRAANYGQKYVVNVNGYLVKVDTPVAPVVSEGATVKENRISSEEIAEKIIDGLIKEGLTGYTLTQQGSVIWIRGDNPIAVEVSDARSNADITAILDSVQAFTELPTIAPIGYQVTVEGDVGNNFDTYYVEFQPRGSDVDESTDYDPPAFDEGSWLETVSPGVEYEMDADTMPHLLVRKSDGKFWFGPAKGQTVTGIGEVPSWGERTCGDYDTAPDPSFIGYPINDVFIYKNRLGFLADENVILTQTREFFKFFPATTTTILDTDPIDLVASNNKVSILRYAVPYQDELILFSSQYQFRFNAAETVLTPKTAQLTVLTQFEVDTNVRPQQAGGGIIFTQQNGEWSQMREFSVRGAGTALTADAADLTGYVSSYIPSELFKLAVNDTGNSMFAISGKSIPGGTDFRNRIYTYKYFFRNQGGGVERAQSSWSYWQFEGVDEVLQILCVEETLYLLMRYGNDVYLEKMSVKDRQEETAMPAPYAMLLDRRVDTTTDTPTAVRMSKGVYDKQKNETTFTLPYTAKAKTQIWTMWNLTDPTSTGPVLVGEASSGTSVVASGDFSGHDCVVGEPYQFRYRFTKFKMVKDIGGGKAAVNAMRTQVRTAKLRYHESGYFKVMVMPEYRDSGEYVYDGTISGVRNATIGKPALSNMSGDSVRYFEGVFNIPIYGQGEQIFVEIQSDRPIPCKFSTCEWVALLTTRAQSLQ